MRTEGRKTRVEKERKGHGDTVSERSTGKGAREERGRVEERRIRKE